MPRKYRYFGRNGFNHLIIRGVNKQDIFFHDADFERFLKILGELKEREGFDVVAYCLMSNHVHLLLHDKAQRFPAIMRHLASRYALYFNKKYGRTGHLFQERYHSRPIDTRSSLLAVVAYIHNNPAAAHICSRARYRWSSFHAYTTTIKTSTLVDTGFVWSLVGSPQEFDALHDTDDPTKTLDEQYFEYRTALPDGAVRDYLAQTTNNPDPAYIHTLPPAQRNQIITDLKTHHITNKQIARVTGLSLNIINRVSNLGQGKIAHSDAMSNLGQGKIAHSDAMSDLGQGKIAHSDAMSNLGQGKIAHSDDDKH